MKKKNYSWKNINEKAMLNFYIEKYELDYSNENIYKLSIFNNYLSLFEKHCINNKEQYKIFIKFLSSLYTREIYYFVEKLEIIIKKGFLKKCIGIVILLVIIIIYYLFLFQKKNIILNL